MEGYLAEGVVGDKTGGKMTGMWYGVMGTLVGREYCGNGLG